MFGTGGRGVGERNVNVLFLNTPTRPTLGADTWIHLQIMMGLDRSTHDVHVACVAATTDGPDWEPRSR